MFFISDFPHVLMTFLVAPDTVVFRIMTDSILKLLGIFKRPDFTRILPNYGFELLLVLILSLSVSGGAIAEDALAADHCKSISDDANRLRCFDQAASDPVEGSSSNTTPRVGIWGECGGEESLISKPPLSRRVYPRTRPWMISSGSSWKRVWIMPSGSKICFLANAASDMPDCLSTISESSQYPELLYADRLPGVKFNSFWRAISSSVSSLVRELRTPAYCLSIR